MKGSMSSGTYWWNAPFGRRRTATAALVTVTVVRSTEMPSAAMRATSGITALVSPTLATWIQTSGPAGRLMEGRP